MKPLDRIGARERAVIEKRRTSGYHTGELQHFGGSLEPVLRALLDRLLPGVPANIDLMAFVDAHADQPMGRGDRPAGLPPIRELLRHGLAALADRGFATSSTDEQQELITRVRRGEADDDLGFPAKDFIDRLLEKALSGYLAHPDTWARIGFGGPAYPEGYSWIGPAEVVARHKMARGWESL